MAILSYVERLAVANQQARRAALLAILRELAYPFVLYPEQIENHSPQNVVVRLGDTGPRLVLGAHYDSMPGSTGANDNAASIAILLTFLRDYRRHPPKLPCEIVFFDLEERGNWGSRAYVRRFAAEPILAMINLDICGVGDTILVSPRKNAEEWPMQAALRLVRQQQAVSFRIVEELPLGDQQSFEAVGIPNLSVSILPHDDVPVLLGAVPALRQLQRAETMPVTAETIHNGPRDSITVIEEAAMQAVLEWIDAIVGALSSTSAHAE
jgi:aminopeptidase YwaD